MFGSDPHDCLYKHTTFGKKITQPGHTGVTGADVEKGGYTQILQHKERNPGICSKF